LDFSETSLISHSQFAEQKAQHICSGEKHSHSINIINQFPITEYSKCPPPGFTRAFYALVKLLILWQVIPDCSTCLSSATDFGFGENCSKLPMNTIIN